jgi:hypothetical protein
MTASAAAETWRKSGWEPSANPKAEYSRKDEITDLVRFHWLYILGPAIAGVLLYAAVVLVLRRTKMV